MCVCDQVAEKLEELKQQHSEKIATKDSLRKKSEEMELKLDRADKLVTGLAGERVRWEERVAVCHTYAETHTSRDGETVVLKVHSNIDREAAQVSVTLTGWYSGYWLFCKYNMEYFLE